MSYHFIDRKDPHIDVMFQGLEKLEKMLSVLEEIPRTLFNGERFLTDDETFQCPAGEQTHIAGIPYIWCNPLLPGTGKGSL